MGPYRQRVRVFERTPGGTLFAAVPHPSGRAGRYHKFALAGMSRADAEAWALEALARLKRGDPAQPPGTPALPGEQPTWANLFASYVAMRTPQKVSTEQDGDARRVELWTRVLGANAHPAALNAQLWLAFQRDRVSGAIDARGVRVAPKDTVPVGPRTVQMDCLWLRQVGNWAADHWRSPVTGALLLTRNPVRGLDVPSEGAPRRPKVTPERFRKLREVSDRVEMEERQGGTTRRRSYLSEILDLLWLTGHRVSAVLALRWDDVLPESDQHPFGGLRWRAETDKEGFEHTTPLTPALRDVLERVRRERPGIGPVPLFPKPTDRTRPVSKERVRKWLLEAETLAELPKQEGSLFHAFRRGWASGRMRENPKTVAAAGGWKRVETLMRHYQEPDAAELQRVIAGPVVAAGGQS